MSPGLWQGWQGWFQSRPPISADRWVVLDVESSGLDVAHDRLLAIAAVGLRVNGRATPRIVLADSFEVVLRQPTTSGQAADKRNILLHGIGVGAQRDGVPADAALKAFVAWLGQAPLLAFHSAFDEGMIQRHMRQVLGQRLPNAWVDLAELAAVAHPGTGARALDDWMALYGIQCAQRHQAAADTLATAELLLKLWPRLQAAQADLSFKGLQSLAAQRRWLPS